MSDDQRSRRSSRSRSRTEVYYDPRAGVAPPTVERILSARTFGPPPAVAPSVLNQPVTKRHRSRSGKRTQSSSHRPASPDKRWQPGHHPPRATRGRSNLPPYPYARYASSASPAAPEHTTRAPNLPRSSSFDSGDRQRSMQDERPERVVGPGFPPVPARRHYYEYDQPPARSSTDPVAALKNERKQRRMSLRDSSEQHKSQGESSGQGWFNGLLKKGAAKLGKAAIPLAAHAAVAATAKRASKSREGEQSGGWVKEFGVDVVQQVAERGKGEEPEEPSQPGFVESAFKSYHDRLEEKHKQEEEEEEREERGRRRKGKERARHRSGSRCSGSSSSNRY